MPSYEFRGLKPVVDPAAFVHPTAVLIGDVVIAPHCYIGPGASLRGDFGRISIRCGANIQDNCVVHCFPGKETVVEAGGHVGHGAVLHGCHIGRNALIGMNAVVMDGVVIGDECLVAAMSFVKAGSETEGRTLWAGCPARKVRELSDDEIAWKTRGTEEYQELARTCIETMRPCEPLPAPEQDRPALTGAHVTLAEHRRPASRQAAPPVPLP